MSDASGTISFRLRRGDEAAGRERWPHVTLVVDGQFTLEMVPNLLASQSAITPRALERLRSQGYTKTTIARFHPKGRFLPLLNVTIEGQTVTHIEATIRRQAGLLGGDGYLGLDFFGAYQEICFRPDDLLLTLRPRA